MNFMKKYAYSIYTLLIPGTLLFTSCQKFVDIGPPKNQLTADKVFADSADATAAITGIYNQMTGGFGLQFGSGGISVTAGLSADELYTTGSDDNSAFFANRITPRNGTNGDLWRTAYQQLYTTNACIEGIAASTGLTDGQKARLTAEAKCARAFLFFNLVNLYGPVPLVTMTDYRQSRALPRASVEDIFKQLTDDLLFAQANLTPGNVRTQRAGYAAATTLLARTYLYRKMYPEAQREADKVISSGLFQLESDAGNIFLTTSRETIWRLLPLDQTGRETWDADLFVPSSPDGVPTYVISDGLYASFDDNDQRKANWTDSHTVNGKNYPFPYKYKNVFTGSNPPENFVLLRLAELYLIRAEARAQTGDLNGAIADLNVIRDRAGITPVTAGTATQIADAIAAERRKEFFCEWGHRWFDLKRTNQADAVLGASKTGWRPAAALFPVPQAELTANPALTQNAGY
jgi:starch-binding outer membrane protein, SusD/RagB family